MSRTIDLMANDLSNMPPRAEAAIIEKGVSLIRFLVEEERRKDGSVSCACISDIGRSDTKFSLGSQFEASSVRWRRKTELPEFKRPEIKHIPPDLHAVTLSFPARLLTYVKMKCGGNGQVAYMRSGVSKQIYSRIVAWDDEKADKKTVMKFCIGLQLDMSEAELLMKSAGYAFSNTIPLDRAFTFSIENRIWNIHDVNDLLTRNGLPDLGLKF